MKFYMTVTFPTGDGLLRPVLKRRREIDNVTYVKPEVDCPVSTISSPMPDSRMIASEQLRIMGLEIVKSKTGTGVYLTGSTPQLQDLAAAVESAARGRNGREKLVDAVQNNAEFSDGGITIAPFETIADAPPESVEVWIKQISLPLDPPFVTVEAPWQRLPPLLVPCRLLLRAIEDMRTIISSPEKDVVVGQCRLCTNGRCGQVVRSGDAVFLSSPLSIFFQQEAVCSS